MDSNRTVRIPIIPPPEHLSAKAAAVWQVLTAEYALDPPLLTLLSQTLDAFDRAEQASAMVRAEGLVTKDRWGQARPHPAVAIERDSRGTLVRCVKSLMQSLTHFPRLSEGGFRIVAEAFGAESIGEQADDDDVEDGENGGAAATLELSQASEILDISDGSGIIESEVKESEV